MVCLSKSWLAHLVCLQGCKWRVFQKVYGGRTTIHQSYRMLNSTSRLDVSCCVIQWVNLYHLWNTKPSALLSSQVATAWTLVCFLLVCNSTSFWWLHFFSKIEVSMSLFGITVQKTQAVSSEALSNDWRSILRSLSQLKISTCHLGTVYKLPIRNSNGSCNLFLFMIQWDQFLVGTREKL